MLNYFQAKRINSSQLLLLLLSGILLFIYSLPHVMALRKLIILVAFLISFKFFWQALLKKSKPLLTAVLLFVILQVWMLIIVGFISNQPYSSFLEWKGQWLPPLMSFVIGIGLAHTLAQSKLRDYRVTIAMIILIPITLYLCANAIAVIHSMILAGTFITQQSGISDHKANVGYLIALLEPILIADMLSRMVKRNAVLPVAGWVTAAILILALFSLVAAAARNGILIMLLAFILGAAMMISEIRKVHSPQKLATFVLAALIFICAFAFISYKTDPRWQGFVETVPLAWDIDRDLLWLNDEGAGSEPLTPSGNPVDISTYHRIADAHEGWRMLMQHPWGMEIARDTFHKLEVAKYGHAGMSHSHNSWIDFGLEVGLPGLLLWATFLVLLAQKGWRAWMARKEPLGFALVILVIMFAVRGLFDSIFRDHMIEQFMLVAALLFSALSSEKNLR